MNRWTRTMRRLPFGLRYWLHVAWSWVTLVFDLFVLLPIALVLEVLGAFMRAIVDHPGLAWDDHRERLRVYRLIKARHLSSGDTRHD